MDRNGEAGDGLRLTWLETSAGEPLPSGHGIALYTVESDNRPLGFVVGFEWYHGQSNRVTVYRVPGDEVVTPEVLAEMQQALEPYLLKRQLPPDQLTVRVRAVING